MLYVGIDRTEKIHRVCIRDDDRMHGDLLARIATIEPDVRQVLFAI